MSPGLFRSVVGQILLEGSKKRTALILRGMSHYVTLKMKVVRSLGTSGSNLPKHTAQQPKIPASSVQKQVCKMKLSALHVCHFRWIKVSTFALHLPIFRCSILSLSLSLSGQGGQLLLSSLNLYLNRRCGEHSTLLSLVCVTPTHRNTHTRTYVSSGKVSSEYPSLPFAAVALQKKRYINCR